MSTDSNRVLALFGPTAVGKTALIERLARDDRLLPKPVVVVSADSVQVYRGLDIGSAKPGPAERANVRHELIDILDPDEPFSVGEFVRLADEACERAIADGALPVVSGGTAYYIRAFVMGAPPPPPSDPAVRAAVQAELGRDGAAAIRSELARVDPESAARIAPADLYRATRALEVYRCSGRPLSSFKPSAEPRAKWNTLAVGLSRPREELYARVDARVDAMMGAGLAAEVEALMRSGYGRDAPGMRALGYAEFLDAAEDAKRDDGSPPPFSPRDLAAIAAAIKLDTRHYAKRQITFMKSLPSVRWFGADELDAVEATIAAWLDSRAVAPRLRIRPAAWPWARPPV